MSLDLSLDIRPSAEVCMCVGVLCACGGVSDSLQLELHTVVSCHMDAWN